VLTTSTGGLDVTEWDSQWLHIEKVAGKINETVNADSVCYTESFYESQITTVRYTFFLN
jgi:hypothetical protein